MKVKPRMTIDEAIRTLRADPTMAWLVRDAYLGGDVNDSIERFAASGEWEAIRRLLNDRIAGATVLDLGAGIGIGSEAFRRAGAARVIAVEPDPSEEVGRGAMARAGLAVEVVDAWGESLPIQNGSVDIAYCRQVLHHAADLPQLVAEIARVLRPGGVFLATREHVVWDSRELAKFLAAHPVGRLAGGENANHLDTYLAAFATAGLRMERVLGPWDSVVNAFPSVRTDAEIPTLAADRLRERFGPLGVALANVPPVMALVRRRVYRTAPGRMYSFLAVKP